MIVSGRTFLGSLAAAFGAFCMPDLRRRIEDLGRPILLTKNSTMAAAEYIRECGGPADLTQLEAAFAFSLTADSGEGDTIGPWPGSGSVQPLP